MNRPRHGRRRRHATALWILSGALLAAPLTAQSSTPTDIDVSPELVAVMVASLAPESGDAPAGTAALLNSLASDPLVSAVLQELGAGGLPSSPGDAPTQADLVRLQMALSGGAPSWLAEAIQLSVDQGLPVVTPLNVLLVLVRHPDADTTAFLQRHGVGAAALAAFAGEVLAEMGRSAAEHAAGG